MLRIFEAIKKSPFLNGNYPFCPFPKMLLPRYLLTHNKQLALELKFLKQALRLHPLRVQKCFCRDQTDAQQTTFFSEKINKTPVTGEF